MTETIMVALLALIGTLAGSFGGILTANKLVVYRIQQLEKKVEKHNSVIERVYKLEDSVGYIKNEIEKISEFRK